MSALEHSAFSAAPRKQLVIVLVPLAVAGILTVLNPTLGLLASVLVALLWPSVGRFALGTLIVLTPWLNPVVTGVENGRIYASHVLVLAATFSAVTTLRKGRNRVRFLVVFASAALYMFEVGLARVDVGETLVWTFRPLFPFLVTVATVLLIPAERTDRWFRFLAYGGVLGCSLAILYALIPWLDPFVYTRPDDIPFVSRIGPFIRAAGAFVYPNNLAMFAAYGGLLALSTLVLDVPRLSKKWSVALLLCSAGALAVAASRAAAGGLLLGSSLLILRANLGRRLAGAAILVLVVTGTGLFLVSTEGGQGALEQRITTAGGSSLEGRQEAWEYAARRFKDSPVFGTGIEESRLDSSWLLYLYTGGLVGTALLGVLIVSLWGPGVRRRAYGNELTGALLIALATTAILQDSLGQSLAVWYPAVMLGLITGKELDRRAKQGEPHG